MRNDMSVTRRGHKKRGSDLLPLLSLTLAVTLLSLGLAGIWQLLDPVDYIPPEESSYPSSPSSSPEDGSSASQASGPSSPE